MQTCETIKQGWKCCRVAVQPSAPACLADADSCLMCHLLRRPWAFKVTQIRDPEALMFLSYQKHFFCLEAAPFQFFKPNYSSWSLKNVLIFISRLTVSANHGSFEMCYSPAEIQYSVFCQRQTLQKWRRGDERKLLPAWRFFFLNLNKTKLFILTCVFSAERSTRVCSGGQLSSPGVLYHKLFTISHL